MSFVLVSIQIVTFILSLISVMFFILSRVSSEKDFDPEHIEEGEVNGISLVICVRNGLDSLKRNINLWLNQEAKNFELIIVNDYSDDGSLEYLKSQNDPRLKVLDNLGKQGKKYAQELGIKASTYQKILLTDVDCTPSSKFWAIQAMQNLGAQDEFLLMYSPYIRKAGFLNAFIRFETLITAFNYFSAAIIGLPYMGVGRNLAIKKATYLNKRPNHFYDLSYGDDDLLVSSAANSKNTAILLDERTWTWSQAAKNWKAWIKQKQRHLSTGKTYKFNQKALLSIYPLSLLLFYILLFFLDSSQFTFYFGLRSTIFYLFSYSLFKKWYNSDLWYLAPFYEFLWLMYLLFFSPYILWKSKKGW